MTVIMCIKDTDDLAYLPNYKMYPSDSQIIIDMGERHYRRQVQKMFGSEAESQPRIVYIYCHVIWIIKQ